MSRIGPCNSPSATNCTRVPAPSGSNVHVPSTGSGPSTTCVCSSRGRSKPVNSTTCSNSLPTFGFVRSRIRVPGPGGPGVICSTEVFDVCHAARFVASVT